LLPLKVDGSLIRRIEKIDRPQVNEDSESEETEIEDTKGK
jgi:hypothetical protein